MCSSVRQRDDHKTVSSGSEERVQGCLPVGKGEGESMTLGIGAWDCERDVDVVARGSKPPESLLGVLEDAVVFNLSMVYMM